MIVVGDVVTLFFFAPSKVESLEKRAFVYAE
jgi:hypothetical protein